ncbi:MAG: methyltransferase [Alphaproteobacteria bacterium]|nr:methyltransferase [Alphaproteobacteria bacterium]MDE2014095.1 methyltransferase [Alphaproteobacteria bacterium]MDE2350689.1 methyltransferase [Alphaproteobacteria bacterium]
MTGNVTPEKIMDIAMGFGGAKALLSAVEFGLFTELAKGPRDVEGIMAALDLHPRAVRDFLDLLVALGLLEREDGLYRNTEATGLFLDRTKPSYVGGLLEMANARLYPHWGKLSTALKTGEPQNEVEHGGKTFDSLYADPARLKQFLAAMTGASMGAARAIAEMFPWDRYQTVIDIGTAQGCLPVQVALRHPHISGGGFDLPAVRPVFEEYVESFSLSQRLHFRAGNFFKEVLPSADVLVMGHILHDWNLDEKRMLLKKAHDALPKGGALIVYESLIDDERRTSVRGLLMSLNMLIETPGGFDFTGAECRGWMAETGFRESYVKPLTEKDAMVVGIK